MFGIGLQYTYIYGQKMWNKVSHSVRRLDVESSENWVNLKLGEKIMAGRLRPRQATTVTK